MQEQISRAASPIAIIGMASIFPEARTLDEFWDNIVQARDCLRDVPASRWNIDDYYDPNPAAADKTYCKRGGFIPDIDFDPVEFGLPPNILEVTDVSQLLGLVVARQTFDDAGYGREGREFDRERTGVVLGVGGGQKLITPLTTRLQYPVWERVLRSSGLSQAETAVVVEKLKSAYVGWEENSFPGLLGNVIAGRIANRFDLGGINCVVDAACAASLAALKLAISELTERRCDLMLTGGVDTDNSIFMYMSFSKTPAFSAQQAPRPFDAESDGMMVGEGVGMLLLKRLDDAERDGDRIYAVIRGIGSSSDGRAKSIYAPRSEGQARALRRAYADAGIEIASVGLIEAHGTGTVAGDICEATTLVDVFSTAGAGQATVALGSVKSQIGHTKAAAGAAGLIKAALALHHKLLPPTLNVTAPNPMLGLEHSPLYLNTEARPWLRGETARRAGVSAFGFGGTNFHVVLEEYGPDHAGAYRRHAAAHELLIQARTPEALQTRCAELAATLAGDAAATFADFCRESEQTRPDADAARLGFVAANAAEASQLLQLADEALAAQPAAEAWAHPRGIFYRRRALAAGAKVIALFAGQGAQQVGMGRELALNYPVVRGWFERLDRLFAHDGRPTLSRTVFPPPTFEGGGRERQAQALQRTEYAQPAIGALSAAMFDLFRRAGFQPDAVAGHSFGELTALWAAGAISDDAYAALAYARGQAMRAPADPSFDAGTMLAVAAGRAVADAVAGQIAGLTIANQNAPEQVVLAGPRLAIAAAARMLADQGVSTTALPVSAAFHTPLMEHAQVPFAAAVAAAAVRTPLLPVYANSTAAPYPAEPDAIKAQLAGQLLRPVQFQQQIERMYADGGAIFVEFGPRNILTGLVHQTLGARPHLAVALGAPRGRDSDRQLREGLIQLRVAGLPLSPFDTCRYEQTLAAPRRRGMSVRINGSNFVSERTRAAHTAALSDGFRIMRDAPSDNHEQKRVDTPMPDRTSLDIPATITTPPVPVLAAATPSATAAAPAAVQLERIYEHQREVLQLQQLFMSNQAEYARAFMLLLQEQQRLLLEHGAQVSPAALEHLERSVMAFHQHQGETLRLHDRYMADQHSHAERLLALAIAPAAPTVAAPAIPRLNEPLAPEALRVAGAATQPNVNGHHPALPASPPAEYNGNSQHPAPPPRVLSPAEHNDNGRYPALAHYPIPPAVLAIPAASLPPTPVAPTADPAALAHARDTLLAVVTELTGYPRETLELEMDMESDLGIDSIKRVQILGVMQERLTALPAFKPETLAELRTLGQVLDHVRPHLVAAVPVPITATPVPVAPMPIAAAPATDSAALAHARDTLLAVVTELTGYPRETLELEMDMESDLGIDSIKRVQILGVMQERLTALPAFKPETLAELRTLGQVLDHVRPHLIATAHAPAPIAAAPAPVAVAVAPPPASIPGAERSVPRLMALPPPDTLECALPAGACCVITDDGTATVAELARALRARGWPAVVLRLPTALVPTRTALPADVSRVVLQDSSEAQLEQALRSISESYGPIAAFIHLHPRADASTLLDPVDQALVRHIFLIARALGPALRAAAEVGRSCFLTVTRMDGALGTGRRGDYGAVPGGLAGLTKTLRHEWPQVFCRALDLSPEFDAAQVAELIMAELHDPDRLLAEVGYGPDGRVTLVGAAGQL